MVKWIDSLNEALLKAAEWAGKNIKVLGITLGLLLVVGLVWAGVTYTQDKKSTKALQAYAPIERDFTTWKTPAPSRDPKAKKEDVKPEASKVDPAALFGRMMEFMKDQGDVPASQLMALMASEVAAVLGSQQEAELLELAKKTFNKGSQLMDGLVLIKKGDLFANQDKCDQALALWKDVLSQKRLSYLHDVTRLKSGLCFEKMAQFKEAEMQYDEVIKGAAQKKTDKEKAAQVTRQNHWAVKEAQKLKRALKWSQKQPSS